MTSRPVALDDTEASSMDDAVREGVYAQAVPIWAKQVESARRQTEQAIVALSQRFVS